MKLIKVVIVLAALGMTSICCASSEFERAAVARAVATGNTELAKAVKTIVDSGFMSELLTLHKASKSCTTSKASLFGLFDKSKAKKVVKEWHSITYPDWALTGIERVYKEDGFMVVQFTMNDFGGGSGTLGYGRMRVRAYVDTKTWTVEKDLAVY